MPRELTSHRLNGLNGLNEALLIVALDEPVNGNACHKYAIDVDPALSAFSGITIMFQNGPIAYCGINGISNEALLAIIEDRLLGFQAGQHACRENAIALTKIQEAMLWLQKRERMRVVEDTK